MAKKMDSSDIDQAFANENGHVHTEEVVAPSKRLRFREEDDVTPRSLAAPVQKVATKYTTAMQVQERRSLSRVEADAIEEARILGPRAFYAWGAGKDRIEGPSVKMANMLARVYGNCAVDAGELQETPDAWIFSAIFIDLQTGFTLTRQFRQAKRFQVFGKHDEVRKDDMRFQIGQSKAIRNVILNALPEWLIDKAMDEALGGVREAIETAINSKGMNAVQNRAVEKLNAVGVTEARMLESMGRKVRAALTVEDLVTLHGAIEALKIGSESIDDLFPIKAAPAPAATGKSRTEQLADELMGNDTPANVAPSVQAAADRLKAAQARATAPAPQNDGTLLGDSLPPEGDGSAARSRGRKP